MIPNRLLVVDDEIAIGEFLNEIITEWGFEVVVATTHAAFTQTYRSFKPAVIILDLAMPDGDGIELLRFLAREDCDAQVLLLSGFDGRVRQTAARIGADLGLKMMEPLQKPVSIVDLEAAIAPLAVKSGRLEVAELRRALTDNELFLHFQPKVEIGSRAVCGAEALVRWQHPQHGAMGPDKFIHLFETEGLIGSLTEVVLNLACRQAETWSREGLAIPVAVNLSPLELEDLQLPDRVAALVRSHRLQPTDLVLEITETAAMTDALRAADILARFRLKGFGISLDDFGTGYSSLVWLHRLPFTELKIDRSFVMELSQNAEARIIVKSIIDLARNLGLSVCAEGVETRKIWDILASLGCERAQGYFVARPSPGGAITEWARQWSRGWDGSNSQES